MASRYEGKQSNSTRNLKQANFVPKAVQRILSSHKSIMNRKCSTGKLLLKLSQHSQENTCVGISFIIKLQAFRDRALLTRDATRTQVFFANIEKLFTTLILKNICERLLLGFSFKLFTIWTNSIGSEEDIFSKIKQNKNCSKTQLYEKTLAFSWCSLSFRISFSPLHVRRHLPYIIKKQLWNSLTNEQLILEQWKYY